MRQTGSHLHCAVLGSPWDRLGSVSVPLILRFTNSPFLWSRPPASAQGRIRVPGVKSGEILPGRVSLSHQGPVMPPHTWPCPLPLSLWLGLSLQILASGHEGHHGAPSSEKTFAAVDKGWGGGAGSGWRVLPGLSGGPLAASPFPVAIGWWQPLGPASRPHTHPPGVRD